VAARLLSRSQRSLVAERSLMSRIRGADFSQLGAEGSSGKKRKLVSMMLLAAYSCVCLQPVGSGLFVLEGSGMNWILK